ncbi:MAG: hypothetical protein P4M12_12200 [Gammaproteobacteria bacterium]|nr:hypothetical protein [Gammaproteobacteria bacterium]
MSKKPARWELFELIDAAYEPHKLNEILHVDKILGAGAYGITVQVFKKSGSNTAITLLRPHAEEQARTEFATLNRAAQTLVKQDKKYEPVIGMVTQAQDSAQHETNMQLADQQDVIAKKLYNNISITLTEGDSEKIYHSVTAEWVGYGERYKETALIPGQHFLELPNNTEAEKARKRHFAIELKKILIKLLKVRTMQLEDILLILSLSWV